ncbi:MULTISPECIES: SIMPL domain-containing protein [unclassified Halorubrum]|uniref:SIMPL domain-containing protein n=1 Tax=unclassified Halorubrum TaxID=2642239 RepID=UPI000B97DDE9|nr:MULTISPECIES: SIMPL domain-containing protein [unclassified Halorubrum]OYR46956.1 SIMPL domain-containing protein [Halorubrum sp. Hd13]OYR47987.1 SIMPL domain-containing protein [Halorubrum sp. Ea8]
MDRRLMTAAGLVLLVALAGCAGLPGSTGDAGTAANAAPGEEPALDRSIEVTADGEATAEPDRATIRVAVTATGDDSAAVRDELSAADESLRAALTDWGLTEDDIRTERYDVRESYETRDNPDRTTYQGVHSYALTIDDVDAVGEVIDVAIDGGADEVERIEFGLSEEREREVRAQAIENAMANADGDAAVLANSSGLEVTGAYRVSTADAGVTPYRVAESAMAGGGDGGDAATGVETGDVSVRVSVNVVYGAEQA